MLRVVLTGFIVVAAVSGWWLWGTPTSPEPVETASPELLVGTSDPVPPLDSASSGLTVHVAGEVVSPGLVELPPGARVADAVAGAGGLRPTADLAGVNLAASVNDGELIRIPSAGLGDDPASPSAPVAGAVGSDGVVSVNSADITALETLPGVGPVLAARILSHREQHGPFQTVEDLLDVPGIGEGRLDSLRDLVAIP